MSKRMMIVTVIMAALTAVFWASFLDESISRLIYQWRLPALTSLMKAVSWIGYVYFLVPVNLLILILLFRSNRLKAVTIPVGTLVVWQFSELLKKMIQRPRPDISPIAHETSYAFPSGHAMSNTAFYMLLFLLTPDNKQLQYFSIGMIVMMNFSRVYLGVHWPSDVFGGTAIALIIVQLIYQLIKKRLQEPSSSGIDE